jgi:glycosyltransferase involved in cell wall biosynthesis
MNVPTVSGVPRVPTDARPAVAMIANSIAPYRVHLHRRIAREIPDIQFWTVFTHEESNSPWMLDPPPEIGPISFGTAERGLEQASPRHALREWRKGGRISRWLGQQQIAAVAVFGYNDPGRIRIIGWCLRRGVPCLLAGDSNIKCDRAHGVRGFFKRRVVGRIVRSCWGVMPCGSLGEAYFQRYGADSDRVFLFPYEPDYELIARMPPAVIEAARTRLALCPSRRHLLFCGRLVQSKRPDLLVEAFVAVADERPDWDLLVVGGGPLLDRLQARVPERLRARVIFTGFIDDQCAVTALYRLSDVLVLPSEHEPWALVVNEAAAAGLAIVSSDIVGAAAELVRDGVNGRLFPAGDLEALARCLREVTLDSRIDAMKAASGSVLETWRRRGDPVDGLRRALQSCGVLGPAAETRTGGAVTDGVKRYASLSRPMGTGGKR